MQNLKMKLFYLILSSLLCFPVQAKEVEVKAPYFEVFSQFDQTGYTQDGIVLNIVEQVAKLTGDQYNFSITSYKKALEYARRNQNSVVVPAFFDDELVSEFYKSDKIADVELVIITKKHSDFAYNSNFNTLYGQRIGVIEGWRYTPSFDEAALDKREFMNTSVAIAALNADLVDVVITDITIAQYVLTHHYPQSKHDFKISGLLATRSLYLIINKRNPIAESFLYEFNQALEAMQVNRQIMQLKALQFPIDRELSQ